ncbi:uncharacterized protein LOC123872376 [Maniola jurtina]|uniref:uncharacterized protein LOC123872376 n=1 Tax=Maniola jurtina TaxID=191418 RepID=UPI001E68A4B5|nr:uncharacterized protein LOC123872376 [Maniola jurtina]
MFPADIKYKDYIQEIYNTFSPLSWLLKIFSLDCHCPKDTTQLAPSHLVKIRSAITVAVLACINFFTLYYKFTYSYHDLLKSVKYTDVVQMVYDLFQYMVDLYFVYKYGSDVFYEYIRQYAYIDGMLGMEYYSRIKRRLIIAMIFIISMWISSSLCDYIIWAIGFGLVATSSFSLAYIYMLIKILTNLHLTLHVMHIGSRLRVIGDWVQECYCTSLSCSPKIEDTVMKKNWFYSHKTKTSTSKLYPSKSATCMNCSEVKLLSRCYLLLTEQVNFINKIFGMRILLNCLSLLIDMVRFTNLTVRVIMGTQHTGYAHAFYPAISTFWRSLTCAIVIVSLVNHCENTYRQRERVISLVEHLIINRNLDEKMLAAYIEFRGLVKSQPIDFHMANFMRLDYSLLVSITSVFVTYTIILLQSI